MRKKVIVILGPTASGKTDLSIKLAKKFEGEIINADSRQIYRGMDYLTAKPTKRERKIVPHHLFDVASPKRYFSVAQYQKLAFKKIKEILKRGKIPFLVGGSWFYIFSIVDGYSFPKVKPDWKLRRNLEKKSPEELFKILKKLDPQRAKTIEKENKRRLIRAIEIAKKIGKVPKLKKNPPPFEFLILGIERNFEEIRKRIKKRILKRLKKMIGEVKNLRKAGVSFKRLESFGLEPKWVAKYLKGEISKEEMIEKIQKDSENLAKRQIKIFKKEKRAKWVKNFREAEKLIEKFLKDQRGGVRAY